ncbi:MAG: lipocalin-like domain-containing protein [Bacteroidota bacterium]
MSGDTTGYARADTPRTFVFPEDHGPHAGFKTEWWYVTGNLRATDGSDRRFGLQFTIFKSALSADTARQRPSDWAADELFMAHIGLSDIDGGTFVSHEAFARGAAGLAGATNEDGLRVWLRDIELTQAAPLVENGALPMQIVAVTDEGAGYDLTATPSKPLVLQGDAGLSQKGPGDGNASYYYAQTRMATTGTVTLASGETVPVEGLTWLDREWSTSALGEGQVGWDWFALHLDDGRDLMIYQLRQTDGSTDPLSKGSLVSASGEKQHLPSTAYTLEPLATWDSPRGGSYPVKWRVRVPEEGVDLVVEAAMLDQELPVSVRYWEGAVDVSGTATGVGYLEMTGYADEANKAPGA